ncbi:MAG: hypothetical protein EBY18_02670 [Alphaproteobacteria bacterium]|nr:hypothetical protein [Alphaproteobacteria bacterium]
MSRGVKLVLMGVAGAAMLYSCAPAAGGGGMGLLPWLWFLGNPFGRGPAVTAPATPGAATGTTAAPGTTTPDAAKATPGQSQSQRGGFGATGSQSGSSGSS